MWGHRTVVDAGKQSAALAADLSALHPVRAAGGPGGHAEGGVRHHPGRRAGPQRGCVPGLAPAPSISSASMAPSAAAACMAGAVGRRQGISFCATVWGRQATGMIVPHVA